MSALHPIGQRASLGAYLKAAAGRHAFLREYVDAKIDAEHAGKRLGALWLLATPLLNAALFFVVFGILLGARHSVPNYPLFLLTGVLLYQFTSKTISNAASSLRKQRDFVRTIPFPRILLVASTIGIEVRHLGWSLLVILAVATATAGVHASWLAALAALVLLVCLAAGIALACARLTSAVPDVATLLPFAVRAGAFLSGVYFPLTSMPGMGSGASQLGQILSYNPIAVALTLARGGLEGAWGEPQAWAWLTVSALAALIGGVIYFWRGEPAYGRA